MNIYVIRITKSGLTGVDVEVERSSSDENWESHLFCEYVPKEKVPLTWGISIAVADDHKASASASWKQLLPDENGILPIFENAVEAKQEEASDILLHLSDTLPLPGSYALHIVYDFRGRDILDSPVSTDVAGALSKLCQWHCGHLEVYTDCELSNHQLGLFNCIDSHFHIHPCRSDGEAIYTISRRELWRGPLTLYGENLEQHDLEGFTMLMSNYGTSESIVVNTADDSNVTDSTTAGNIWIGPKIRIASLIEVTTLPTSYYFGKNFELHYKKDDRYLEHNNAVESIYHSLSSKSSLAYLGHLHYAISDILFPTSSKLSSARWHQSIMEESTMDDVSNYAFASNVSSLYFLLSLPQKENLVSSDVVKFSCAILKGKADFDWKIPRQLAPFLEPADNNNDTTSGSSTCNEPLVNIIPLVRRYVLFKLHTSKALTEWISNHVSATAISGTELRTIIDESFQHIGAEIAKSWKRCIGVLEPLSFTIDGDNVISIFIYETQKAMLRRFENVDKANDENLTEALMSKSTSTLDMHLAPHEILLHFLPSGECRNGVSILKQNSENQALPSPSLLCNFDESMKLNYHGVLYNVDELESEKYDRACRRLVEKCVKFETRSIGSIAKVPSHCIMPVGDSPPKNLPGVANTMQNSHLKKTHLKKVADKMHQKRILKRKSDSQLDADQSVSMVLRSTPKKKLQNISENVKIAPKEQKRHHRKTYVQDNKKRLEKLVANSLIDNGVPLNSKQFESCSRRLYNVCMAFLRKLKSSKNLDKIMRETVDKNVRTVISFDA